MPAALNRLKMAAWGRIADADDGDSISDDSISIEQYCFASFFFCWWVPLKVATNKEG